MTQPPTNLLLRIEQLLNAGKLQEARMLLVDFIQSNPNSSRAWWLLSMTLADVDRQVSCLKRVLRLDPENKLARQRLDRLSNQLPPAPSVSPFTSSFMGEMAETSEDMTIIPDWAKPAGARAERKSSQPPARQDVSSPMPVSQVEPPEPPVTTPTSSGSQESAVELPASSTQKETPVETPAVAQTPEEPEIASPVPVPPIELVAVSPTPSEIVEPEPSATKPLSPIELMAPSTTTPEAIKPIEVFPVTPGIVEPQTLLAVQPEPIAQEAGTALPPETIEPEVSAPEPAPIPEPDNSANKPVVPVEPELALSVPSSKIEPEAIASIPEPASEPDESAQKESIPIELDTIPPVPPATAAPEIIPAKLVPVEPEAVEPGPAPVSEPVESIPFPPAAPGSSAASLEPILPDDQKTLSTKRALFSELDKSFHAPPAPLQPVISTPHSPAPIETNVPAAKPAAATGAEVVSPKPPAPAKPVAKAPSPDSPNSKWEIIYILIAGFVILAVVAVVGYIAIQRKAQQQALAMATDQNLQETLAVAQTLTNLPLPTLIPTWTPSITSTGLPTHTYTHVPTSIPTSTLIFTLTRTPRPASQVGPNVGLYAPDFNLTDATTGKQVTLSQHLGQPVLIFFWATWCLHCSNEIGSIETISVNNKGAGLVVLTVDAAEGIATVTPYLANHNLTVPILLDPDSIFKTAYNINLDTIPLHFFIDSAGMIKSIRMGELTLSEIQTLVDGILQRVPTATP